MKPTNIILVHNLGNVVVFYIKVKETDKSIWLQKIGTSVKKSHENTEHVWEVVPNVNVKQGEVFRKLKTKTGRVKMSEYNFLTLYAERKTYTESKF